MMRFKVPVTILIFCICSCLGDTTDDKYLRKAKAALLTMFELDERPLPVPEDFIIPKTMEDLYQLQMEFDLDTASIPVEGIHAEGANTVRSFLHNESEDDRRFDGNVRLMRLRFNVTIPFQESLKAAQVKFFIDLYLRLQGKKVRIGRFQRVYLYDIVRPGSKKRKTDPILRLLDTKIVDIFENDTVLLDPLAAVARWVATKNKENYGLLIRVSPLKKGGNVAGHIRLRRAAGEPEQEWAVKRPMLLTYSDDGKNKQKTGTEMQLIRSKRAARRGHRKGDRDACRRQQMYVNFSDVGWSDWIVAPLGYDAFFCSGECTFPLAEHMNTTNHAIVQSLMHSVRPYNVPKACCVPTQLSSMSMLYVDSLGNVILKNYKEMVVIGCGCR